MIGNSYWSTGVTVDFVGGVTTLVADAKRLGITFTTGDIEACVYVDENRIGEYPDGWAERIADECEALGWKFTYGHYLNAGVS